MTEAVAPIPSVSHRSRELISEHLARLTADKLNQQPPGHQLRVCRYRRPFSNHRPLYNPATHDLSGLPSAVCAGVANNSLISASTLARNGSCSCTAGCALGIPVCWSPALAPKPQGSFFGAELKSAIDAWTQGKDLTRTQAIAKLIELGLRRMEIARDSWMPLDDSEMAAGAFLYVSAHYSALGHEKRIHDSLMAANARKDRVSRQARFWRARDQTRFKVPQLRLLQIS
jgi:hypothetical protein